MTVLVVGSVSLRLSEDTHRLPRGLARWLGDVFLHRISRFAPVSLIAVIGDDFQGGTSSCCARAMSMSAAYRGSRAGHSAGRASTSRRTSTPAPPWTPQLNVFADFSPKLNAEQRRSQYLFLANIDPGASTRCPRSNGGSSPELVALDSMNFWIDGKRSGAQQDSQRGRCPVHGRGRGAGTTLKRVTSLRRHAASWQRVPARSSSSAASTAFSSSVGTRYSPRLHSRSTTWLTHRRGRHLRFRLHGLHRRHRRHDDGRLPPRGNTRLRHGLVLRAGLQCGKDTDPVHAGHRGPLPRLYRTHILLAFERR